MSLLYAGINQPATLHASAARTATGTGTVIWVPPKCDGIMLTLNVTAAASDTGDTLDVVVQSDTGAAGADQWLDVCAFTQVVGDGGAKTHIGKIASSQAQAMFETASALGAGSVRHLIGRLRVKWTIAAASPTGDESFTFEVLAVPM